MLIVKDFGATCLDQTWTYVGAEKEVSERHQASEGKTLGCSGWKGEKASFMVFLAVHNSSIGLIVPCLVGLLPLTIRVFTTLQSDPRDL